MAFHGSHRKALFIPFSELPALKFRGSPGLRFTRVMQVHKPFTPSWQPYL